MRFDKLARRLRVLAVVGVVGLAGAPPGDWWRRACAGCARAGACSLAARRLDAAPGGYGNPRHASCDRHDDAAGAEQRRKGDNPDDGVGIAIILGIALLFILVVGASLYFLGGRRRRGSGSD